MQQGSGKCQQTFRLSAGKLVKSMLWGLRATCCIPKIRQFRSYLSSPLKIKLRKKAVIKCHACHKQETDTCLEKTTLHKNALDDPCDSSCHHGSVTHDHSHAVRKRALCCAVCEIIAGGLAGSPIHSLLHIHLLGALLGSGLIGSGLEGVYYTRATSREFSFIEFIKHTGIGFLSSILASLIPILARFSKWIQLLPVGKRLLMQLLSGSLGAVVGRTIHLCI